jgi:hypothetical protein
VRLRGTGIYLAGGRVSASGRFTDSWESTGIEYRVEIDSSASSADLDALLQRVDTLAEIPRAIRAIRAGVAVTRVTHPLDVPQRRSWSRQGRIER